MSKETKINEHQPGDGLRSMKTSAAFKIVNFELFSRPNKIIMGLGLVAITGCSLYIAYMRQKYESLGYYSAIQSDGKETFLKKKSKWE